MHVKDDGLEDTSTIEQNVSNNEPQYDDKAAPVVFGATDQPPPESSPGSSTKDLENASPPTSSLTYPEGGLRAWLVVLGSFSGMVACFGFMNSSGTFQLYLSSHQLSTSSPAAIGWIFSLYVFLAFFCGVQIGPIFDALGPRWLVFAGTVLSLVGTFTLAESTLYWHFLLTYGLVSGVGTSLIFTPAFGAVAHFFSRRRGLATGLAATGGSVGGMLYPLILPALFDSVGYAWGVRIMGFTMAFLLVLANLLIRGRLPRAPHVDASALMPDFRIFRSLPFALTTAGVFFIEWGLFVPLTYTSSWALATGVGSPAFAYQLIAILNAGSFFGRWGPGLIADHVGRFNTIILACLMCIVSVLALWLPGAAPGSPVTGSVALAVVFVLVFGLGSGSGISLTPVCVGQLCKTEEYGRYYATCFTVVSIGCLTGVPIAGALLEACGGAYTGMVAFTAACYAAGMMCFAGTRVLLVGWRIGVVC